MDAQKFNNTVSDLKEYEGVEEVFLLSVDGEILFKNGDFALPQDEADKLLKAWKEKEGALVFQGNRFAILKNDEIQLAAKNIAGGKGNIVGSITKEGDYLVAHTQDEGMILLEWSIHVNKVAWK